MPMSVKRDIADAIIAQRKKYDVETRLPWDKAIHDQVIERTSGHKVIALYAAFNHEVDTYAIMETLWWDPTLTLVLPKISNKAMTFHPVTGFQDLTPGQLGILEPTTAVTIDAKDIDMMLIPMVAFNRNGYRIGYGAGYYDRYLKDTDFIKIGLAYDFQETTVSFEEMHDISCDAIITNREVIHAKQ